MNCICGRELTKNIPLSKYKPGIWLCPWCAYEITCFVKEYNSTITEVKK